MSPMTKLLLALLALETTVLVVTFVLYRKAKKASQVRRVEAPNSAYKSQYVQDLDAKERWERMDLSLLHEVNREEVEKLLDKVRATSVRALTSTERAFLDRMADAHDRAARESKKGPPSGRRLHGTSS